MNNYCRIWFYFYNLIKHFKNLIKKESKRKRERERETEKNK
jgi:hypothetical protein